MSSPGLPIEKIKAGMRATWMAGDFGVVAKTITKGAEAFVGRVPIPAGARVLDVACGTGNLAIPLARKGMEVIGVDIAPNLLEQGRGRATTEGLKVKFDEGDAEQLPYLDGSFDAVVTMFGAMFAPRPEIVASELVRVLKQGGLLAMANWTPGGFTGQMFRVGSKHAAPPPGLAPPVLWGDDATVRQRLAPGFSEIQTEVIRIDFELPMNPAGAVDFFRKYFGPTQVAFGRLDENGQKALASDLVALWSGANLAANPSEQTLIKNEYLQVIAKRR
jgi:SAM-dependent methyltransferase